MRTAKNLLLISIFFLTGMLIMSKFYTRREVISLDNKIDKEQFTIYKQKDDKSGYDIYNYDSFPEGYRLNNEMTVCLDNNGDKQDNIFTFNNGKFTVTSNKTVFCTLYFDFIPSLTRALAASNPLVQEYKGEGWVGEEDPSDRFFTNHIYYWYVPSSSYNNHTATENAEIVRNSWNVVYAGHCWQIIRTTENGGVKLLYNGEPDIGEDLQGNPTYDCSDNRNLYHMGEIESEYSISGSKVYGDTYTATTSGTTTTFTLVNNDESTPTTTTIDSSNASTVVGKYTCGSTSTTCTNVNLRKIVSIKTGTTAIVYTSTQRDNIGLSKFNIGYNSPAYVGYMYNYSINYTSRNLYSDYNIFKGKQIVFSQTFTDSTSFSDNAPTYNSTINQYNYLPNPQTALQIKGSDADYSNLVGKYTFNSVYTQGSKVLYYVVAVDGNTIYVKSDNTGDVPNVLGTTYTIGTSIVDNFNGTYTIGNTNNYDITTWTASTISPSTSNYYYMCKDGVSTTCTYGDAMIIMSNSATSMSLTLLKSEYSSYGTYKIGASITKSNNEYILGGTTTNIIALDYNRVYNSNYNKYICINGGTSCTIDEIYYIAPIGAALMAAPLKSYSPNNNIKLSNTISYSGGMYTLDMNDANAVETFYDANDLLNLMGKAHYACIDSSGNFLPNTTSCSEIAFIYESSKISAKYIKLSGGQYVSTDESNTAVFKNDNNVLYRMLYKDNVNETDSIIKLNVDKWYEANILNTSYESLIDNAEIYCGDRSTNNNYGSWNLNANNISTILGFSGLGSVRYSINEPTFYNNLSCPNKTDAYSRNSTVKGNGALNYSIALINYAEIFNMGNGDAFKHILPTFNYWLISPSSLYYDASTYNVEIWSSNGRKDSSAVTNNYGVRPAVSLTSDAEYSQGNGSMTNPYVVSVN